jgi:hypothetical protein
VKNLTRVLLALALMCLASPAIAQDRWTSTTGAWSIGFAEGWTYASPLPPEFNHLSLVMIPEAAPADADVRMCVVQEDTYADGAPPERIRQFGAAFDMTLAQRLARQQNVTALTYTEQDGVVVAAFASDSDSGRRVYRHRVFYLPNGAGQVLLVHVSCFWPSAISADEVARMEGSLDSLQFNASGQPT